MEEDLRNIYRLLKELYANAFHGKGKYRQGGLHCFHSSIAEAKTGHFIKLSEVLFEELLRQSENLRDLLRCSSDGVSGSHSKTQFTKEGFILLLRCCLVMLPFLEFDMTFLWDKCGVLLKVLGKFCPLNLSLNFHDCSKESTRSSFLPCCSSFPGGINEEDDQLLSFFPLVLEVFIAEFSENIGLRKHLVSVHVLAANSEKLCSCRNTQADICAVRKLVFSHSLQLVINDLDFSRFLRLLSSSSDRDKVMPDISLDTSINLISTCFISSSPLTLQAHLILLASKRLSIHHPIDDRKFDTPVMSCCINPLKLSVSLYLSYLSALHLDDASLGTNGGSNYGTIATPSSSSVHKMACDKQTHQVKDFVDFSQLLPDAVLFGTKSEIKAYYFAYIRGNHPLIDQLCKETTCLIVDYIMDNILTHEERGQRHIGSSNRLQQEVFCLAASMKLMNSSLLNIIQILKQTAGLHDGMKALRDCSPCMLYENISQLANIIHAGGCRADQQVQKFLCEVFGDNGGIHEEIKLMLAHFSSLLVFSFVRKIVFLLKGCISIMMALISLLHFEERNQGLGKIFKLPASHPIVDYKGVACRSTSMIIARNMETTRMLCLNEIKSVEVNGIDGGEGSEIGGRSRMCSLEGMGYSGVHEIQETTCNGESFIECVPSYHGNPSEWEDLVDFIECSPGKDYLSWLNNRKKVRQVETEKKCTF